MRISDYRRAQLYEEARKLGDPAVAAREDAIERVERNAADDWKDEAKEALLTLCRLQGWFICDDLRELVDDPREPRAFGAILRHGQREGWCRPIDKWIVSDRVSNHKRPERVWLSLIVGMP